MERWGWSKAKVRNFLQLLQNDEMIVKKTDRRKTTITIENYSNYSTYETSKEPQKDCKKTTKRLQKDTNNNVNNDNNVNNENNNTPVGAKGSQGIESEIELVITLPLNDGTEYAVDVSTVETYEELYPAVDVEQQLRSMKGWLMSNPSKRKTRRGITRFINSWLAREQDNVKHSQRYQNHQSRHYF